MSQCVFCDIIAKRLPAYFVHEDSESVAFLDHRPLLPGHVLHVPRQHYPTLGDLPREEVGPFFISAQRLALARALASARGLLIVDEPTSRQDENNARAVAALLVAAAHEEGQTVICATHDPAVIRHADKVVVLGG